MSDTNPDYETLLRLRALETDPVQKAIYTEQAYQFNVPLTDVEKQFFAYTNFDYVEDTPEISTGDSYVGVYFANSLEPSFTIDNTVASDRTHRTHVFDSNGIPLVSSSEAEITIYDRGLPEVTRSIAQGRNINSTSSINTRLSEL